MWSYGSKQALGTVAHFEQERRYKMCIKRSFLALRPDIGLADTAP